MQEEDIMASNSTLRLLAATLQEHNEPIPFQVPSDQDVGDSKKSVKILSKLFDQYDFSYY